MSTEKIISVTRLVRRMRNLLEIELGELWVEGEVSNLRKQASGHIYFTLKDVGAQIGCVLFKGNARQAKIEPDNGMKVRLFGEISVYEARGSVQLVVRKVEPVGEGDLQARFEHLKNKLKDEGLFSEDKKLPIPEFPRKIGLITSGTGAALQDMLNVLSRRAPWVQPILYPVQVQGAGAEHGIADAINLWSKWSENEMPEVDVIILGRGGGSLEDLWNFNEEVVARAIYSCNVPIVSAVGHEIDFTISDFVSDMRAPTPSAAAELVVPDGEALLNRLGRMRSSINRSISSSVEKYSVMLSGMSRGALSRSSERVLREPLQRLLLAVRDLGDVATDSLKARSSEVSGLQYRLIAHRPESVIDRRFDKLEYLKHRMSSLTTDRLKEHANHLTELSGILRTLGPDSVFARGFSITLGPKGDIVKDAEDIESGHTLITKLHKGEIKSTVI